MGVGQRLLVKVDVAVIGAGIVGCATARALALRGFSVAVVDREQPGSGASWAAAGMLAPQAETHHHNLLLPLLLRARERYPTLSQQLRAETGLDIGYRSDGMLVVALDSSEADDLEAVAQWQSEAGLEVSRVSSRELASLEPAIEGAAGALLIPGDHQVDNRRTTRALWFAAHGAGAHFINAGVTSVARDGKITLHLDDGSHIDAGQVVIAAGAWSGQIDGLPQPLPVEPVFGEIIQLETAPPLFRHTISASRGYMVPRADGRLLIGATVQRIGFRDGTTAEARSSLLEFATSVAPILKRCPVSDHWSGLRPGTPDDLPILGSDPLDPRVFYATGHYRNGILLGPLTGELIAAAIQGELDPILEPFSISRFATVPRG